MVPAYRLTPAGPQNVAVYTDEHGEAQVGCKGAFFEALARIRNGGCDLEDVDVLGTTSITATARYPYKPVSDTDKASDPANEAGAVAVPPSTSGISPRVPVSVNSNARIIVAHASTWTEGS